MKSLLLQLNKTRSPHFGRSFLSVLLVLCLCVGAQAQVNSGSTGADGAFNPTANTVINMADHPDGIYHYTTVNIPAGITVTFIPNANNTPVVWLVQNNCVIDGTVDVSGQAPSTSFGGSGGPGGGRGGHGQAQNFFGQGPGGAGCGPVNQVYGNIFGGNGSYGTLGGQGGSHGAIYGNVFVLPLLGGSGGGGATNSSVGSAGNGGGGGGGAILIAASELIALNGNLLSSGGVAPNTFPFFGGHGSGGAIRMVSKRIQGGGGLNVGGYGAGRIRLDTPDNNFTGTYNGVFTQGFQPIIIPTAVQGTQLAIASVAGAPVPASPNGLLATPDSIIAAQSSNPVAIVVRCTNLPMNTPVTVTVKPANGAAISAVGYNTSGTLASSTVTVQLNMPRGGGLIYATAATAP